MEQRLQWPLFAAALLTIPVHTVRRELRVAQAWLRKEMAGEH